MKLRLLAMAVVLGSGVLLVSGCTSGDSSLSLEEYFAELGALQERAASQFEQASELPEDDSALLMDEANLPLLKEVNALVPTVLSDMLDRLETLDPPSEAEEAHTAMVAALAEADSLLDDAGETLDGAQTIAEFTALSEELDATLAPAFARFDDACFDLMLLAAENNITAELDCFA
jgi:hypothetical protein